MVRIRFGDTSPETLDSYVVVRKAEDVKQLGYRSRYSQQTAYLRSVLGEVSPRFNGVWGQGW
jgi:hypothetical protein